MTSPDRVYEMLWDCSSCGTRKLLGMSQRFCANCGSQQDPTTRYFPEEHEKVAVRDHVFHGADVFCAYCNAPNSAAARCCVHCGAPVGDEGGQAVGLVQQGAVGGYQASGAAMPADEETRPKGRRKVITLVIIALVIAVVGGIVGMMVWTQSATLEVAGHTWTREIRIERFAPKQSSAWCDSMPRGAYSVSRAQKKRSTKKIPDGETCTIKRVDNGDGTYREVNQCKPKYREEPVYDAHCRFTVDRWQHARSATATGNLAEAPRWPPTKVRTCQQLGCEREGRRSETYRVLFTDPDGDRHECDFAESRWRSMAMGSRWQAEVKVLTGGLSCDSIRAAN